MIQHSVEVSAEIAAPAERVYGIVSDYREGHPRILPQPFFPDLTVEAGGSGAGTVIRFTMHVAGKTKTFRSAVTEPEPGRVLVETDRSGGPITAFTVDALDGERSRVTISTRLQRDGKPLGMIERYLTLRFLRRIYAEELRLLSVAATEPG